jgi:hypothetical protein
MGGHCSQKLCPGGEGPPLRGAADLRINTRSTTLSQRSDARGPVSQAFSFPRQRRCGCLPPRNASLTSSVRLVSAHRYSALAAWSPLARQNGSLPRRRQHVVPRDQHAQRGFDQFLGIHRGVWLLNILDLGIVCCTWASGPMVTSHGVGSSYPPAGPSWVAARFGGWRRGFRPH